VKQSEGMSEADLTVSIELDHSIGNNARPNCLCYHPNKENYIYCSGWSVGIGSLTDIHSQEFLRQHDDAVQCLALSSSGSLIASGQTGHNADIVVWAFDQKQAIFSFEEHDFGVKCLSFSPDEKLLASIGVEEDGKLIIWDLSNGCIVAASPKLPTGTSAVACGGFVRDIKRRETDFYQFCTAGREGVVMWELNPYSGEMVSNKFLGDPRASISRSIASISFSTDQLTVYCATSSGDYISGSVRARKLTHSVIAAKKGLGSVHRFKDGVITGGGDGSIKVFNGDDKVVAETVLDGPVLDISLSPDDLEVIASTALGSIFRLNLQSMNHLVIAESHRDYVVATSFSDRYADKFATASRDGTVRYFLIRLLSMVFVISHIFLYAECGTLLSTR
jgi:WD40 repeat protein